jgi:D-ribose pyranose/furanose isomerase RbsD
MPDIPRALALLAASSDISIAAVHEDQVEEIKLYMLAVDVEDHEAKTNRHYLQTPTTSNKSAKIDHKQLKENLKKASADIVVGNTQNEYRR